MKTSFVKIGIFQQFVSLQEYRKKIKLNGWLEAFLDFSEQSIKSEYEKGEKKPNAKMKKYKDNFDERLVEGYETQTTLEKLDMYIRQMKYIKDVLSHVFVEQTGIFDIMSFDEAYTLSYNLKIWKKKSLKLSFSKGVLEITKDEKTKSYHLQNYLIRQSKNSDYHCFVLQALNSKVNQKNRVIRIGFKKINIFQQWFLAVKSVVMKMQRQIIRKELEKSQQYLADLNSLNRSRNQKKVTDPIVNQHIFTIHQNLQNKGNDASFDSSGSEITIKTVIKTILNLSDAKLEELEAVSQKNKTNRNTNIFATILPDYNLESLDQQFDYELVYEQKQSKIVRNKTKHQRYKVFIPMRLTSLEKIANVLCDVNEFSVWNPSIEQISIKNVITSENMIVVYQKFKQYNSIYRPRDFLFLRHVFMKDQHLYIVDKSIENSEYPASLLTVRGTIQSVCGIIKNKNGYYSIVNDIVIQNQGIINSNQDHNLSLEYLKGFLNIKTKISNYKQNKNKVQLFNLNWRIHQDEINFKNNQIKNTTKSVPTSPFRPIDSKTPPKQVLQHTQPQRRKTIQQQQKSQVVQKKIRRCTVQEKSQQIENSILNRSKVVSLSNSKVQDLNVNVPITSINYEYDKQGYVVIPQEYISHRYSFVPSKTKEILLQEVVNGHAIWKGQWKFDKDGGLIFINQTKIQYQKGVFKYVLSKIAKNLLSGKSVLQISLPVDIFAPETNLQRFAFSMTYAPILLEKAFKCKTGLQKFKWVIAYGITNSVLYLNMEKPFNPILGQTFQGWINGCPIYLQQVSHHPPIASFLFLGRGYKITGSLQSKVQLQMNSGCGTTDGVYRIMTDDGSDFNFITPGGQISGLTFGDRRFNLVGKYYVWSKRHQLFVQIKLDPTNKGIFSKRSQPSDYMQGNIYQVKRQFLQSFQSMKKKQGPSKQKIIHNHGKASGVWSKILMIDGQAYLDLDRDIGCKLQYDSHLLPSDGNWRQDVAYKKLLDIPRSQTQKQRLQIIQRQDRKLRQKNNPHKKH